MPENPNLRVTWLEACPSWCAGEQCHAELEVDRQHVSVVTTVPVVVFDRDASIESGRDTGISTVFDLAATQRNPSSDIWVFIGDDDQMLELSFESAQRLHRALGHLLGRLEK